MPVAGHAPGTIDQRISFPENTIVELRRWKQHYNSLKLFIIGQAITLLACLGGLAYFVNARAVQNTPLYVAGTIILLILGIMSLVGVVQRYSIAVPLIWLWIGLWALMSITGAVVAFSYGASEGLIVVLQLLVYVVVLIVFVGKALAERERIFGPERINEHELHEELAYREINSIP